MINTKQLADNGGNRNTSNTGNRTRNARIRTIRGTEAKQRRVEEMNFSYIPSMDVLSFASGAPPPFLSRPLGAKFKC